MFKLKPGVSIEAYKKFSREIDQKVISLQPGVKSFEAYEIKGAEKGEAPCQIVEAVEVESWEVWQKVLSNDAMKPVLKEWGKYGDENSVVPIYGEKIK
jgi:hypothetical protein